MIKKRIYFLLVLLTYSGICCPAKATESNDQALTLPGAVAIAVRNYAAVQQATEELKGAEFDSQSTRADMLPKLKASYNATALADDPYLKQNGRQVQVAHNNQFFWDITVSQPLFTGFALSTRYEMSRLNVEIQKKEKDRTILDVVKGVKSAYYSVLLARKMLVVADDTVEYLKAHEHDAHRFFKSGLTRRNDWLRTQVTLADAVQARERAKANLKFAVSDLNRWLAYDINRPTEIEDIPTVSENDYRLEVLIENGLQNRPIMQAMHLILKTLEKAIKLEKSTYYPEVALIASYHRDGDNLTAQDNDYYNDHNALVGIRATWTLFDSFKRKSKVAKARSDKRAFMKQIRLAEDGIRLEIKNAYLNHRVARKNIETSKTSLASARENMRITNLGYRQQAATSTEVLDATADLTQAESNYYQALYGYLDAVAHLDRATGKRGNL